MSDRQLEIALLWEDEGRPDKYLLFDNTYRLAALWLWVQSAGARAEGISDPTVAFINASKAAKDASDPGWYEYLLRQRLECDICGTPYRFENLAICMGCLGTYCPDCIPKQRAVNGNPAHACGGEVVG